METGTTQVGKVGTTVGTTQQTDFPHGVEHINKSKLVYMELCHTFAVY